MFKYSYMDKYPFFASVLEHFPDFDYNNPIGNRDVICDMSNPGNMVGQQQRAFIVYWALKQCSLLDLGLDLGSNRSFTPFAIHVDKYGDGAPNPLYPHDVSPSVSDVIADMCDLSMFPSNTFAYVASNHSLEHIDTSKHIFSTASLSREIWLGDTEKGKYGGVYEQYMAETDAVIVKVLREHWIRVLRPGGILAMVVPDHAYVNVFDADKDHKHAWMHFDFNKRILAYLSDLIDVVEYDTLKNNFSINVVLRKK